MPEIKNGVAINHQESVVNPKNFIIVNNTIENIKTLNPIVLLLFFIIIYFSDKVKKKNLLFLINFYQFSSNSFSLSQKPSSSNLSNDNSSINDSKTKFSVTHSGMSTSLFDSKCCI